MGPYAAVAVFVGIGVAMSQATSRFFAKPGVGTAVNRRWTYFDYLVVLALVSFSALRFQVGTDYLAYLNTYQALDTGDWARQIATSPQEFGYTALSLVLHTVSDWPYLIFWATAALTVIPVYATLKKQSNDLTLAVLLYILLAFFVNPFNIIRQGIAVSLNFWANSFLGRSRTAFVLINVLAALFHSSVIIAAIIQVVVRNWKLTAAKMVWILAVGIAVAIALVNSPFVLDWIGSLNSRYSVYAGEQASSSGIGTYLNIAVSLALLIYSMHLGRTDDTSRWMTCVAVGIAFLVVGSQSVVVARMGDYFSMFIVLLLPNQLAQREKPLTSRMMLVLFAAVYFAFFLLNYGGLTPYQTYLSW